MRGVRRACRGVGEGVAPCVCVCVCERRVGKSGRVGVRGFRGSRRRAREQTQKSAARNSDCTSSATERTHPIKPSTDGAQRATLLARQLRTTKRATDQARGANVTYLDQQNKAAQNSARDSRRSWREEEKKNAKKTKARDVFFVCSLRISVFFGRPPFALNPLETKIQYVKDKVIPI